MQVVFQPGRSGIGRFAALQRSRLDASPQLLRADRIAMQQLRMTCPAHGPQRGVTP